MPGGRLPVFMIYPPELTADCVQEAYFHFCECIQTAFRDAAINA
jgi:hypothetical protein